MLNTRVAFVVAAVVSATAIVSTPSAVPSAAPAQWVESPAEGTVERAGADEGVAVAVGIPIPAGIVAGGSVLGSQFVVGLSQVLRAQTAPVHQLVLRRVLAEARGLLLGGWFAALAVEHKLVVALHFLALAVGDFHVRLALEDHHFGFVGVELVVARLLEARGNACVDDLQVVLVVNLIYFHAGAALFDLHLR